MTYSLWPSVALCVLCVEKKRNAKNRMIPIPEHYKDWFKKPVKIILLAMESTAEEKVKPQQTTDLNRFAGTLSLTEEPLEFQKRIRGEWL